LAKQSIDENLEFKYTQIMERIIAIANQKGGVGKSTTVVNLAAGLEKMGKRVAVIDLDSQGALTISLGFNPYDIEPSSYDLLVDSQIPVGDVLVETNNRLNLAPANAKLAAAEYKLYKLNNRTSRLKTSLDVPRQTFDYILIDTPPHLGLLTVNGLVAAQELLIPVAADYLSMRGVRPLLDSVWLIREHLNPDLKLLGVLPTMVHTNSPHAKAAMQEMKNVFKNKVFHSFIPYDNATATAPAMRQSSLDYAPESAVAKAYQQLAKEVSHA
jgi:chromosome partitioning protein